MLKLGAGGAGMFALTASGFAVPRGLAGTTSGSNKLYIEAFPTSPLILNPFTDVLLPLKPEAPVAQSPAELDKATGTKDWRPDDYDPTVPATVGTQVPTREIQDSEAVKGLIGDKGSKGYLDKYQKVMGQHQFWPGDAATTKNPEFQWQSTDPLVYQIKVQANGHEFTKQMVQPINSFGKNVAPPGKDASPRYLPQSTIWGFNGTFPGPMINAEYGRAALVRFENHLFPGSDRGHDPQDFGSPSRTFLTHLHNGHTAPESDGQPHYSYWRFKDRNRSTHDAAWQPGEYVDQLYLGYPAGGYDCEKQSFFWFHDHVHGHTGANVYKGMVGLMPIYDPKIDNGDETNPNGRGLPGVRTNNADGSFSVDYDMPFALYDTRLDDGVTPHKDAHNGDGSTKPGWWGMTYFRHFPNHGFVGDIFTVNGKAYPQMEVKRRRYRLRFLDASISRIYNLTFMHSGKGPVASRDMGLVGDELQGQYRLPDGQQCLKMWEVCNEGGMLPKPIQRDSFELWPAKRREVVVDFSKYQDGFDTQAGDEIYLVNTMKMTTGRMWDLADPNYKVPLIKFVISGDKVTDNSKDPATIAKLRDVPPLVKGAVAAVKSTTIPTFELQRGTVATDPETEWLINGLQFDPTTPLASPRQSPDDPALGGEVWRIRNGGGGWVHPFHLHMEEHLVVARNGKLAPDGRHPDDTGKEDVVALDPGEDVVISRRFRTFTGPYVAHCHNLAHEDHNMMFGWEILPPKAS
jgi:FtsP/CotA-like multicopper oxidase with cupredoxin domain